jgi:endonuclease YncB( thermonuclease family)
LAGHFHFLDYPRYRLRIATKPAYTYRGVIFRVIDGDTYEIMLDLGFNIFAEQTIRLEGVDTPELNSKDPFEKAFARMVKERVEDLVFDQRVVIVTKYDKTFARYVASVWLEDDKVNLADWITSNKLTKADIPK